jgi:hypothetical protein
MSLKSEKRTPAISELRIDQEIYCTDKVGVANPNAIINLKAGQNIKIFLPNGESFTGIVTSEEYSQPEETVKILGHFLTHKNAGFGFYLSRRDGAFKGAMVFADEKKTYDHEFNPILKGFAFQLRRD